MTIDSFIQALPTVAQSPLALIGYILLLAAWFVLALRVKRNKNLLEALEKIPSEQRLAALQAEMGNVSPPEDLTPQQWLSSRIHTYYFLGFLSILFSLTLIAVVTYILAPKDPSENIFAEISSSESPSIPEWMNGINIVSYSATVSSEEIVSIEPTMPYIDAVKEEMEVHGFQYWREPFKWMYPQLSAKVVNNSDKTVLVSELLIEVVDSNIDITPLPIIHENFYNVGAIGFVNEGWGAMSNVTLRIDGWNAPAESPNDIVFMWRFGSSTQDPCNRDSDLLGDKMTLALGDIDQGTNVEVEEYVPEELKDQPLVCAFGSLSYTIPAKKTPKKFKFRTLVSRFNPGPGAPAPPTAEYDLFLEAGKKGYTASLPVSQKLEPGEVDHFLINVSTDKSASFKLSYKFKEVSGFELGENKLNLSIFIPRGGANKGTLSERRFPMLPPAVWGGGANSGEIERVAYNPDDKKDIRIFLKNDRDKVGASCEDFYSDLLASLKGSSFPSEVYIGIVDKEGTMFCRSGTRYLN
jgi:hypothetical protein